MHQQVSRMGGEQAIIIFAHQSDFFTFLLFPFPLLLLSRNRASANSRPSTITKAAVNVILVNGIWRKANRGAIYSVAKLHSCDPSSANKYEPTNTAVVIHVTIS